MYLKFEVIKFSGLGIPGIADLVGINSSIFKPFCDTAVRINSVIYTQTGCKTHCTCLNHILLIAFLCMTV